MKTDMQRFWEALQRAEVVDQLPDAVGMPGGAASKPGGAWMKMRVQGPDYTTLWRDCMTRLQERERTYVPPREVVEDPAEQRVEQRFSWLEIDR